MMDIQHIGNEEHVEVKLLEEEYFGITKSSEEDTVFDGVIGNIEDIILDDGFQNLQQTFMEKYYKEFDDSEENKLIYTSIFNEYVDVLEKFLEQQLIQRIPGFSMKDFIESLKHHKDEVSGDIFDMLLTFTDFVAFKEMFLFYKAEREGKGFDLSTDLVVKPLRSNTEPSSL